MDSKFLPCVTVELGVRAPSRGWCSLQSVSARCGPFAAITAAVMLLAALMVVQASRGVLDPEQPRMARAGVAA